MFTYEHTTGQGDRLGSLSGPGTKLTTVTLYVFRVGEGTWDLRGMFVEPSRLIMGGESLYLFDSESVRFLRRFQSVGLVRPVVTRVRGRGQWCHTT